MNSYLQKKILLQESILQDLNYLHNISEHWKYFFWRDSHNIYSTPPVQNFLLLCTTNKILDLGKLWNNSSNNLCFERILNVMRNSALKTDASFIEANSLFNVGIEKYKKFKIDYIRDKYIAHKDINADDVEVDGKYISEMIAYSNRLHNLIRGCLHLDFEPFEYNTNSYDAFFTLIRKSV